MRINQVQPNTPTIDEASMSTSDLESFAKSDLAKSAMVGFEAEMYVPGLKDVETTNVEYEPDYDIDVDFPTDDGWKKKVQQFFTDSGHNDYYWVESCITDLVDLYTTWQTEQFYEKLHDELADKLYTAVANRLPNDATVEDIQDSIESEDRAYLRAEQELEHDFYNENMMKEFCDNVNLHSMKDFFDHHNTKGIIWPVHKAVSDPDSMTVDDLEHDFVLATGFKTTTGKRYHSVTRTSDMWIFEPDTSIDGPLNVPNDHGSGIELVSPPMPLDECLDAIDSVFDWAGVIGAESNKSTGFHIGVSLPKEKMATLDPIKLILFLGDEYVLKKFNRDSNEFAKSSLRKIYSNLGTIGNNHINPDVMLAKMKKGLDAEAVAAWGAVYASQEKHVSVNVSRLPVYVEFRSAGDDYFDQRDDIKLTMLRYVKAMTIAADPNAEKKEYAKKLYKLLSRYSTNKSEDIIRQFVQKSIEGTSNTDLKDYIKNTQRNRKIWGNTRPNLPEATDAIVVTNEASATVEQLLARYADMPGDANEWISNKVRILDNIVADLRKNAYAPEIKIFGSAAEQNNTIPDEFEIFIDLGKIPLSKEHMSAALNDILRLCRRKRGVLKPYILVDGAVWTNTADSSNWDKVTDKSNIVSNGRRGLPITLFDRIFANVAHAGIADLKSTKVKESVLDWIATAHITPTVIFDGQEIPVTLAEQYTPIQIAAMLGGHSADN